MKAITKVFMLVIAFTISSVQAIPVTINYTVDNTLLDFGICANAGCTGVSTLVPNNSNWKNADSYTLDLAPGTYEFSFTASNFGNPSRGNPAGLLAEILWAGNTNVSSSDWDVTTDGTNYVSATEWAQNGTGVWRGNLLGEISSDAQWLWTDNNFNSSTDRTAGFRTSITVPAPSTIFLLGLAIVAFAMSRKLRA